MASFFTSFFHQIYSSSKTLVHVTTKHLLRLFGTLAFVGTVISAHHGIIYIMDNYWPYFGSGERRRSFQDDPNWHDFQLTNLDPGSAPHPYLEPNVFFWMSKELSFRREDNLLNAVRGNPQVRRLLRDLALSKYLFHYRSDIGNEKQLGPLSTPFYHKVDPRTLPTPEGANPPDPESPNRTFDNIHPQEYRKHMRLPLIAFYLRRMAEEYVQMGVYPDIATALNHQIRPIDPINPDEEFSFRHSPPLMNIR